jgi:hypothetical protein
MHYSRLSGHVLSFAMDQKRLSPSIAMSRQTPGGIISRHGSAIVAHLTNTQPPRSPHPSWQRKPSKDVDAQQSHDPGRPQRCRCWPAGVLGACTIYGCCRSFLVLPTQSLKTCFPCIHLHVLSGTHGGLRGGHARLGKASIHWWLVCINVPGSLLCGPWY